MFRGGHETVTHSKKEYVRPGTDVRSNSIEGVFSLIKGGEYRESVDNPPYRPAVTGQMDAPF
jgi:hypothetical protein